jgi:TonB family protein
MPLKTQLLGRILVRPMTRRALFLAALTGAALLPSAGWAYEPTAMTTEGRVLQTSAKKPGPWHADVLKHEWGEYPYQARSRRLEGTGWFRLQLRLDGSVADVKVMESTGASILDQSAVAAFFRWRFKPGKWKWVDEPMWFSVHGPHGTL